MESLRLVDEKRNAPDKRTEALQQREEELLTELRVYSRNSGILLIEIVDEAGISLARERNEEHDSLEVLQVMKALGELEAECQRSLKLNRLQNTVLEFEDGLLSFSKLPGRSESLAVLGTASLNLGMLRMENKKMIRKIIKILEKYASRV